MRETTVDQSQPSQDEGRKSPSRSGIRHLFPFSPLVVLLGLMLTGLFPVATHSSQAFLATLLVYFMWVTLSESWNLVGGYAGLLNLGLVAFFSLGAIVGSLSFSLGISMIPTMLIGGIVGAVFALVLIPTFRLRSDYFAIATLVVPVIIKPLVEYFTGKESFSVPESQIVGNTELYYVGLSMTAVTIFGIYLLMKSRVGIALRSMGDDETAASSLGVNIILYKTIALVLSGFIASVTGVFYLQILGTVNATIFQNLTFSLFPIFMVVIGGMGTFEGPIIGALIFGIVDYYSPTLFANSNADTLVFSIVIMAVAVLLPRGMVPFASSVAQKLAKHT
jgi:branched-chain amino acid transport system permease protein